MDDALTGAAEPMAQRPPTPRPTRRDDAGRRSAPTDRSRRALLQALLVPGALAFAGGARAAAAPSRRLALALGSGALHGHAHIGVMRVFEQHGVKPDLIVGTSVGAIVGALWAAGLDSRAIERAAERFSLFEAARLAWPGLGLMRNDGLRDTLRELLGDRPIESWPTAFGAVATDFATGERVILDRGDGATAVAASACMPVLFEPVERDGRRLVDGALVEPVPVRAARALRGQRVVAIDIAYRPGDEPVHHVVDAAFQAMHVLINALIAEQIGGADVRVDLDLHHLMLHRRNYAERLIAAGERAALKAWPRISD